MPTTRSYRGLSAADRDAQRRARLVEAGLEVFGTEGFTGSTIEQLCSRAGVTARNFYDHFTSREALLRAVYDHVVERHRAVVEAALREPAEDVEALVRGALRATVQHFADDPRTARVMHVQAVGVGVDFEEHRLATVHAYAALVEQTALDLVALGVLPPRDRQLTALALVGAMDQLLVSWLAQAPGTSPEPVVDELVRLFVRALP